MIEAIENFLVSINPSFGVFAVSLVPVIELRGAIPLGIGLGLNWFWVYIISVIGNLLPVPFVILLIRPFINWLLHSRMFRKLGLWLDERTQKKTEAMNKYKKLGLFIFVAIPFPGTGAYTGATIAGMLNMRLKDAVPAIALGVVVAGIAMLIISCGIKFLF